MHGVSWMVPPGVARSWCTPGGLYLPVPSTQSCAAAPIAAPDPFAPVEAADSRTGSTRHASGGDRTFVPIHASGTLVRRWDASARISCHPMLARSVVFSLPRLPTLHDGGRISDCSSSLETTLLRSSTPLCTHVTLTRDLRQRWSVTLVLQADAARLRMVSIRLLAG
jgi:hypothetical protein